MEYYYDAYKRSGGWRGKVYHYDSNGNKEVLDYKSEEPFDTEEEALDDAAVWCEENDVDASLA